MPNEFFLDPTGLDTTADLVPRAELDRYLAQTGHMRQVDRIIHVGESFRSGAGVKVVRPDEFWVPGHIPGRPIFPGVLMIEAAAQLCSYLIQKCWEREGPLSGFLGFTRADDIAFRGQVVPGDTLVLMAREVDLKRRRFISEAQGVVNGKLVFEGRITGMTF